MRENTQRNSLFTETEIPDNQQERLIIENIPPEIGWYMAGFTDGEGSFNISTVNRNKDFRTGWKIVPTFNISQRDHSMLELFQKILGCGRLHDRGDGVGYYDVRKIEDIIKVIIPFFERFPLRSVSKKRQFEVFKQVCVMIYHKLHLTRNGVEKILILRETIHVARKRKYTRAQILNSFRNNQNPQRLHAKSREH